MVDYGNTRTTQHALKSVGLQNVKAEHYISNMEEE